MYALAACRHLGVRSTRYGTKCGTYGGPSRRDSKGRSKSGTSPLNLCGKDRRRFHIWSHSAWTGHQGVGTQPRHTQACVLDAPVAVGSVLLAGRSSVAVGTLPGQMVRSAALRFAASISLSKNQLPATTKFLEPMGPPATSGAGPPGSAPSCMNGSGAALRGGPWPLRQARVMSVMSLSCWADSPCPARSASTLY